MHREGLIYVSNYRLDLGSDDVGNTVFCRSTSGTIAIRIELTVVPFKDAPISHEKLARFQAAYARLQFVLAAARQVRVIPVMGPDCTDLQDTVNADQNTVNADQSKVTADQTIVDADQHNVTTDQNIVNIVTNAVAIATASLATANGNLAIQCFPRPLDLCGRV